MIETDGAHYDELRTAIEQTVNIPGPTLEIGCRRGGSSVMIMQGNLGKNKTHVAVDPYGNIDYQDRVGIHKSDYTNYMKTQTMVSLYNWAYKNNYNFLFFNLEDTEFFKRFSDGVPVYTDYKTIENKFSLVFVDGPHHTQAVLDAFEYFKEKMSSGGQIVFDNYDHYDHNTEVEPIILAHTYELVATGVDKKVYKKL